MRRTFRSYAHGCARSRWTRSAPTTTKHTCCTTTADAPPMQRSTATASAPTLASSTALTRSLQALERDKLPIFSSRTCRSCASVSTVGACAASVYAQSGYAATTHRTAHSNTTFRPEDALTGRARTQPTTKPEGRTLAEREQLAAQLRAAQAHVAMSHQHAATVASLSEELALTNMQYDASNLFGFDKRARLPGYVRAAAAAGGGARSGGGLPRPRAAALPGRGAGDADGAAVDPGGGDRRDRGAQRRRSARDPRSARNPWGEEGSLAEVAQK